MRGYFGIGIENGKTERNIGTLWRSAHCFGAAFIFTIGARYLKQPTDTTKAWLHVPLYEYQDFHDFNKYKPIDSELVGIELDTKATPLETFIHPERALYLLGPEDGSISFAAQENCDYIVQIGSKYCLNVAIAGSIVMYDRNMKS